MTRNQHIGIVLSLVATVTLLVLAMPRAAKFSYDYKKGSPWGHETLFAQFDFPIVKTEDQILDERARSSAAVIPYYRHSAETVSKTVRDIESAGLGDLTSDVVECLRELYAKGIVPEEGVRQINADSPSDVLLIQRDKRAAKYPVSEVLRLSDARVMLLNEVGARHPGVNVDSVFMDRSVYDLIMPDLVFDSQTTDLVRMESTRNISSTSGYVSAGQLIVSKDEIVTAEVAQMLDSYKKEYEENMGSAGSPFLLWSGNILLAVVIVAMFFFALYFTRPDILGDKRFYYILTIFIITSLAALVAVPFGENVLLMVPFTLAALFLQAFFSPKLIVPVYAVSLLPLLLFSGQGVMLYTMFFAAGIVSIYCFKYFNKGWKQFVCAMITFLVLALVLMAFKLSDLVSGSLVRRLVFLFFSSILTVAGYPLIYLFEKIFNLVSNSRLIELADTSNKLLRELEKKAPGTLQHSLQVMNMADAAARAIDANPLLVRAGALYHDIGKMENPQCFVENESLVPKNPEDKYHNGLSSMQSAHDIIRHVSAGVELAQKNGLPDVVTDFILTHHGTSTMRYFYQKFINEGGSPELESEFRYDGRKPATKEQIILMLCDSIEAASRTLSDYSQESFSRFVDGIFRSKMEEGQFDDADISIHELGLVRDEIRTYLSQMYHERVVYPTNKQKTRNKK